MDGAAREEKIGDDIWKGGLIEKFKAIRYGHVFFQDILEAKDIIKGFMQRGEYACVWGHCAGRVLWSLVDGQHDAGKWGWIFPLDKGR